jgi:hypothetical protein
MKITIPARLLRALNLLTTDDPIAEHHKRNVTITAGTDTKLIGMSSTGSALLVVNCDYIGPLSPFSIPRSLISRAQEAKLLDGDDTDVEVEASAESGGRLVKISTPLASVWTTHNYEKTINVAPAFEACRSSSKTHWHGINSMLLKRINQAVDMAFDKEVACVIERTPSNDWILRDADGVKFFAVICSMRAQPSPQGAPWFQLSLPVGVPSAPPAQESPPLWNVVKLPDITPAF